MRRVEHNTVGTDPWEIRADVDIPELTVRIRHYIHLAVKKKGLSEFEAEEVEDLSNDRFEAALRGNWLANFVGKVANQHYGAPPVTDDLDTAVKARIGQIAKRLARENDAEFLEKKATDDLDMYIATRMGGVVNHTLSEYKKRETPLPLDDRTPLPSIGPSFRAGKDTRQPSDLEREEHLRLVFGGDARAKAHQLLAYAYYPSQQRKLKEEDDSQAVEEETADAQPKPRKKRRRRNAPIVDGVRRPQAVVEDLGSIAFEHLAMSKIGDYQNRGMEAKRALDIFAGLLKAVRKEPAGRLADYWNPVDTVAAWEGKKRLNPLQKIAVMFRRHHDYQDWRIVASLGARTGMGMADDFRDLCDRRRMPQPDLPAVDGTKTLNQCFKPHRKVGGWSDDFRRQITSAEHSQAQRGVAIILNAKGCRAEELMAFLLCHCLNVMPVSAASEWGGRDLTDIRTRVIGEFGVLWKAKFDTAFDWFAPLVSAIRLLGPNPRLSATPAGFDNLARALESWTEKVRGKVEPEIARHPELGLFAARHHLHPDRKTSRARGGFGK